MKKALYIYGFNSNSNSSTKTMLDTLLKEFGYEVVSIDYDQMDPNASLDKIEDYVEKNNIDLVIGSSLGAFYVLCMGNNVKKLVINPCMFPSKELQKIVKLSDTALMEYKRLESFLYEDNKLLSIDNVMGLFGTHDELFSYYDFFKSIFNKAYKFNSPHRPTIECFTKDVMKKIGNYVS